VAELWSVLGALVAVVLPLMLAWWLLGRGIGEAGGRRRCRGNMRREEDR
jgi:hypothetical protein